MTLTLFQILLFSHILPSQLPNISTIYPNVSNFYDDILRMTRPNVPVISLFHRVCIELPHGMA